MLGNLLKAFVCCKFNVLIIYPHTLAPNQNDFSAIVFFLVFFFVEFRKSSLIAIVFVFSRKMRRLGFWEESNLIENDSNKSNTQ